MIFIFFIKVFHNENSGPGEFGIKTELRDEQPGAADEPRDAIFIQCLLHRGQQYFTYDSPPAAQDNTFGVHDVDENS